jgi:hypothetical protein
LWIADSRDESKQAIDSESATNRCQSCDRGDGDNKVLARDVSAMTVDGGVLLHGVGGDDRTPNDELMPFEAATIDIRDIPADDAAGTGRLAVSIPGSPGARTRSRSTATTAPTVAAQPGTEFSRRVEVVRLSVERRDKPAWRRR